jgi:hypothetical protein
LVVQRLRDFIVLRVGWMNTLLRQRAGFVAGVARCL